MKQLTYITWRQWATLVTCLGAVMLSHHFGNEVFAATVSCVTTVVMALSKKLGDPPDVKRLPYELVELKVVKSENDE